MTEDEMDIFVKSYDLENDLLDRKPFVDRLLYICETLSNNRKGSCFAINGAWGVGKSFVLNMFENQIKNIQNEETNMDKYLLFHYDCWDYDYYEEPIIAIVASILDQIDNNVNALSEAKKQKVKALLRAVGSSLLIKANDKIEKETGINIKELCDIIHDGNEDYIKKIEDNKKFDIYFNFKSVLIRLQKTIKELSEDRTVVFVVDELDRCLPEYMIKVLERLHHIFYGLSNVQVIIAIDKGQLEHTIKQIYGNDTEVDKYLAKFIEFELKLNPGRLNDQFNERFSYYISRFEYINNKTLESDVASFQKNIFNGIDMRSRIELINKCDLLHGIICKEEKNDFVIMCIEMFLIVLKYWNVDLSAGKKSFSKNNPFYYKNNSGVLTGLDYLTVEFKHDEDSGILLYAQKEFNTYVRRNNIWSVIFSCYRYVVGFIGDKTDYDYYKEYNLNEYCDKFWKLLNTIN